jgi:hypothetical protein
VKARHENDTGLLEMLALVREELDEVKEKLIDSRIDITDAESDGVGEIDEEKDKEQGGDVPREKEKEQEQEQEQAEIGDVMAAHKGTLKPPCALPIRSKGGPGNAREFTK